MGKSSAWALVNLSGGSGGKVELSINGQRIPATQMTLTYGINDIPTASAMVPLGRSAQTGQPAAIYAQVSALKQMASAEIIVDGSLGDFTASGTGGRRQQFPEGPAVIFKGYVSGITYRRSQGQVMAIVNLVSKLFDLTTSSAGSADVVPGAPNDFLTQTLQQGPGGSAYGEVATKFINKLPAGIQSDFSFSLLDCFNDVAQNNMLQTHDPKVFCTGGLGDSGRAPNTRAINVINSFGNWEGIATFSQSGYMSKYAQACPMDVKSAVPIKIAMTISSQAASSLASTSMWGILNNLILPEFGCGIVPMARGAILAPILPMAQKPQIAIDAADYFDFNFTAQSQRPLYGVGVLANFVSGTLNPDNPKLCMGASYVAPAQEPGDGMWLFVPAPKWLDDVANFDPKAATGNADVNRLLGEVAHDAVGIDNKAVENNPDAELEYWNDGLSRYAQMMYTTQALRGREGTLISKLRFDVAPGTTILVRAKGESISEGTDSLAVDLVGFVARVHVLINAEQPAATTTFELTNLRTSAENCLSRFSMPEHPFFGDNYFKYAPIVPELALPPAAADFKC